MSKVGKKRNLNPFKLSHTLKAFTTHRTNHVSSITIVHILPCRVCNEAYILLFAFCFIFVVVVAVTRREEFTVE